MTMPVLAKILIASLASGVLSLLGGVALLARASWVRRFSLHLVSFAVGALFAAAFLDLLPEAVEMAAGAPQKVFLSAAAGVFIFFALERLILQFHPHHHDDEFSGEHHHPAPILLQVGDTIHNFIDGVAVAVAFLVNPSLGVLTAVAVAAHEIPQEIADFSVMLHHGWSRGKALAVNLLSSFASVLGATLAYSFRGSLEAVLPQLLGFTAGIFIYIAGSDLIPEVSANSPREKSYHAIFLVFFGFLAVAALAHYLK